MRIDSFSDTPIWIVLDELVIVFVALPDGRRSNTWIGCLKRAWRYERRNVDEIRIPEMRKENSNCQSRKVFWSSVGIYQRYVCQRKFPDKNIDNIEPENGVLA